jgi:uncharacterized peroxidase-related enzyme
MSRIAAVDPNQTHGKVKDLLGAVNKSLGVVPNLFRVAAQSQASLEGLLALSGALAGGKLGPKVRESIALAVAQANGCDYCLSAHTVLGRGAGLTDADISLAREGNATVAKVATAVRFARVLAEKRGEVSDGDLQALREAGFTDGEVVEIVANVVVNIFTNYLNLVAATEIDFPVVRAGQRIAA